MLNRALKSGLILFSVLALSGSPLWAQAGKAAAKPAVPAPTAPAAQGAKDCIVSFYLGEVEVRAAAAKDWQPVEIDQALKSGDVVRTMVESRAELTLADGTKIEVGEKSIFEIKKVDGGKQQNNFKVLSGKIAADVKKLSKARSEFKMESPVAIAAIRGTKFSMFVKDGQTDIAVSEGKIEVKMVKSQQSVALGQNQTITVTDEKFEIKVIKETPGKDETPPKLNMESPSGAMNLTVATLEVKGQTEHKAKVKINGEDVPVPANGKFAKKVEFKAEGAQKLTISATDTAGNELEMSYEININISAPEIKAVKSVAESTTAEVCVVSGTVTDKTPDDVISFKLNGEDIQLGEGGAFSKTLRLVEGDNSFKLEAADKANHAAKVELKVRRIKVEKGETPKDAVAPVLTLAPVEAETEQPTVSISGRATDNYPVEELAGAIKTPEKTEPLALSAGNFQYTATLKDGENKFTVTITDKAGNTATADVVVTKKIVAPPVPPDNQAPTLTVSTSLLNEFTNMQTVVISGTAQEQPSPQGKVVVTINREKVDLSGTQFRYTFYLQEGLNKIVVTAADTSGNVATQEFTYFFDRLAPNITITRPAAGVDQINFPGPPGIDAEKTFVVMGFVRDPDPSSGIESMNINGQEIKLRTDGSFEYTVNAVKGSRIIGGQNYQIQLEISVRDRAGNETVDNSRTINLEWGR